MSTWTNAAIFIVMIPVVLFLMQLIDVYRTIKTYFPTDIPNIMDLIGGYVIFLYIVVLIIVGIAILLFFVAVIQLKNAWEVGMQKVQKCGNEFLEAETANYNLFHVELPSKRQRDKVKGSVVTMSIAILLTMVFSVFYSGTSKTPLDTNSFVTICKSIGNIILENIDPRKVDGCAMLGMIGFFGWFLYCLITTIESFYTNLKLSTYTNFEAPEQWHSVVAFACFIVCLCGKIFLMDSEGSFGANRNKLITMLILLIFMMIIIQFIFQYTKLYTANNFYKTTTTNLMTKMNCLSHNKSNKYTDVITDVISENTLKSSSISSRFCKYLMNNIKSLYPNGDPPNSGTSPTEEQYDLWQFMMHQTNGKELEELYQDFSDTSKHSCEKNTDSTLIDPCTKHQRLISRYYMDDGKDHRKCNRAGTTDGIRELLKSLRNYSDGKDVLDELMRYSQGMLITFAIMLFYPLFHMYYMNDSTGATVIVGMFLVSLFIIAATYSYMNHVR